MFVEPADGGGIAKWADLGIRGLSFELTRALRDVLCGIDPPVDLTRRAAARPAELRATRTGSTVDAEATIIHTTPGAARWWTWAGYRANATTAAALSTVAAGRRPDDFGPG
ncbi:hypothetical protein [Nocardia brevicatena]|uniref:hypothetical protein n=1 Tax=Nocardia brevicatena TaxID=37327 RepID=UPI0002DB9738|nr:hypothetical protein [Nocardia brevicatena]